METKKYQVEVNGSSRISNKEFRKRAVAISHSYGSQIVEEYDRRRKIPNQESRLFFIFDEEEKALKFRRHLSHNPSWVDTSWVRDVYN